MKIDARIEKKLSHQMQMDEINERRMVIELIKVLFGLLRAITYKNL
jgi:abortive infection bacteriophage resistance protein